jgi:glutathione S-transferase
MDFPNLPYFFDGDFKMTETMPIHKYIAEKYKPELLGKDAQHKASVNMLANVIFAFKMKLLTPCYMNGDQQECLNGLKEDLPAILEYKLNQGSKFIAGDEPVWLDFLFLEMVYLMNWLQPTLLTDYPSLATYKETMCNLPGLKEYIADPNCIENNYTFNNKVAKINGTV